MSYQETTVTENDVKRDLFIQKVSDLINHFLRILNGKEQGIRMIYITTEQTNGTPRSGNVLLNVIQELIETKEVTIIECCNEYQKQRFLDRRCN